MTACPVIIQVFFGSEAPDGILPMFMQAKDYHGLLYWQAPDGNGAVYRWSFDMVTCGDERWVVFGPFASKAAALAMLHDTLPEQWLDGWRIINEHCAAYCGALGRPSKDSLSLPVFEFYREAWTDG